MSTPTETMITDLSCAVLPEDDFTGKNPIGRIKMALKEIGYEGIRNDSGYYLFLNLDNLLPDLNTLVIESEDNYYEYQEMSVTKADIINHALIKVKLIPTPSYPFLADITLVRGNVKTETTSGGAITKTPVTGALVSIADRGLEYVTSEKGEFFFYFRNLRPEDVIVEGQKKFIKMGSDTKFSLSVSCDGFQNFTKQNQKVEAYKTNVINAELIKVGP